MNTVIKTAVLRGLRLKKLKRAFPMRLPSKSPNVARTPPKRSNEKINSQPDTEVKGLSHELGDPITILKHRMTQLKRFANAIGSRTVIFLRSISTNPEFRSSPNKRVIVTRVEPIASAIA